MPASMPIALTIAGSDSGGGAGIQADLKTFHSFAVYGTSVIVSVTAQNTLGVRDVHSVPVSSITAQLNALRDDLPPAAVKTGMLGTPATIRLVAEVLQTAGWRPYVLDPVMVATSGDRLLEPAAEADLRAALVPLATLVTPNLDEATLLTGLPVHDEVSMRAAGLRLLDAGAAAVLVKGGHLTGDDLLDLLVTAEGTRVFRHRRIPTTSTHGTGCSLSAAITAGLAHGRPLDRAVEEALDWLRRAIAAAPGLGAGRGPVRHDVPPPAPG